MPNHIRNIIKFKNLKPMDVERILTKIATYQSDDKSYMIDFDKIIPEPRRISECPDYCIVNKDSHVMEDADRPWFDWYTWHIKFWGTKWGAYDGYTVIGKSYVTFVFNTAWNAPEPIINKLTSLGYDFEVKYADENIGCNCGRFIYAPTETGFRDIISVTEEDITNPVAFARRVWTH